jgi:hypothetical protein
MMMMMMMTTMMMTMMMMMTTTTTTTTMMMMMMMIYAYASRVFCFPRFFPLKTSRMSLIHTCRTSSPSDSSFFDNSNTTS